MKQKETKFKRNPISNIEFNVRPKYLDANGNNLETVCLLKLSVFINNKNNFYKFL